MRRFRSIHLPLPSFLVLIVLSGAIETHAQSQSTRDSSSIATFRDLATFKATAFHHLNDILVKDQKLVKVQLNKRQIQDFKNAMHLTYGYAYTYDVETLQGNDEQLVVTLSSRFTPKNFETLHEHAPKLDDSSLTQVEFTYHLAQLVHIHTGRPYLEDPRDRASPWRLTAFRLNHSTSHCMRQGVLAIDIVNLVERHPDRFLPMISGYVSGKLLHDNNFRKKLEFVSAFQRTGRESEAAFNPTPLGAYRNYGRSDVEFFKQAANLSGLFDDTTEINDYALGLNEAAQNMGKENPLGLILFSAHTLDLRRMFWFDWNIGIKHLENSLTKDSKTIADLAAIADNHLFETGAWYPKMPGGHLGPLYAGMYSKKWFELHQENELIRLAKSLHAK